MNFLNSLLIGSAEWSQGLWTVGPLDEGGGAKQGLQGLDAGQGMPKMDAGWNSGHRRPSKPGRMGKAFCPKKLIWRPLQAMG